MRGEPSRRLADLKAEIEELETQLDGINATLIRAHFASGSAVLVLSEEARSAMISAARQAEWVRVRGGADSTALPKSTPGSPWRVRSHFGECSSTEGSGPQSHREHGDPDFIATNRTVAGPFNESSESMYISWGKGGEPVRVISESVPDTRSAPARTRTRESGRV